MCSGKPSILWQKRPVHAARLLQHYHVNSLSRQVLRALQVMQLPVAWTDCEGGRWVAPCRALLPDRACARNPLLAAAVSREGMPLVTGLPPALLSAWQEAMPGMQTLSPAAVRAHLKAKGPRLALMQLPEEERLQVGLSPTVTGAFDCGSS